MPQEPLSDCIRLALETCHANLAVRNGLARRYPAAVAPFAAVDDRTPEALGDLARLLEPGESVYLLGERPPDIVSLRWDGIVACLQMVFPADAPLPPKRSDVGIEPLNWRNAQEMLDLITVAFPGYFRPGTCRMGRYYGVRDPRRSLVAMGGERIALQLPAQDPWREVSGLCSHPAQAGRALGTAVMGHILGVHRAEGSRSWLHVDETNRRAIDLYLRLGFQTVRRVELHRMQRVRSWLSSVGCGA